MTKIIYQLGKNLAKIMWRRLFIRMPSVSKPPREILTLTTIIHIYLTTSRKQHVEFLRNVHLTIYRMI
jgi:hypothetical protein